MWNTLKAAAVCGLSMAIAGCYNDEPLSLKIAHINDTHSHFDEEILQIGLPDESGNLTPTYAYVGGYPRLKTYTDQLRDEAESAGQDFLLLHGGDAFSGSLYFSIYKGQLNADFMNYFGFDAMAIGNHEFDLGNQALADFADQVSFPLLSANIKTKRTDPLHGKYLAVSVQMLGDNPQPVAIVGLTTAFTALISSPSDETVFKDAIETAQKAVDKLTLAGINKVIFLTHQGLNDDKLLARSVSGIDVIIGGHTPELLGNHLNIGLPSQGPSPILEQDPEGNPVCIMKSVDFSRAIGNTDVEFSGDGRIESCEAETTFLLGNIFARGTPPTPLFGTAWQVIADYIDAAPNLVMVEKDTVAQSMVDAANLEVAEFSSSIVGAVSEPLYHVQFPGGTHPSGGVQAEGSAVAPHVAASMSFKMEQTTGQPHIGIMNAGGVRSDLIGDITVGDAYTTLPFSSTLVSLSISGQSLIDLIQTNTLNAYLISGNAFTYVSNLSYSIDLSDPANPIVSNVMVKDSSGVFSPIDTASKYNVATTSYLAGGGDGYVFNGATAITDTGHVDAETLVEYIQSQPGAVLDAISTGITVNN